MFKPSAAERRERERKRDARAKVIAEALDDRVLLKTQSVASAIHILHPESNLEQRAPACGRHWNMTKLEVVRAGVRRALYRVEWSPFIPSTSEPRLCWNCCHALGLNHLGIPQRHE